MKNFLNLSDKLFLEGKIGHKEYLMENYLNIAESMKLKSVPLVKNKKKSRKQYVPKDTFDVNSLGAGVKATEEKIKNMMLGKKKK